MKTWEMLKTLHESKKPFGGQFFKTIDDEEEPIFCFLRPQAGSIEFRLFNVYDRDFVTDNVTLYPDYEWVEVIKEVADIYLKGNYELLSSN